MVHSPGFWATADAASTIKLAEMPDSSLNRFIADLMLSEEEGERVSRNLACSVRAPARVTGVHVPNRPDTYRTSLHADSNRGVRLYPPFDPLSIRVKCPTFSGGNGGLPARHARAVRAEAAVIHQPPPPPPSPHPAPRPGARAPRLPLPGPRPGTPHPRPPPPLRPTRPAPHPRPLPPLPR